MNISRKGAKTHLESEKDENAFLCVFAPLRELNSEETAWQIEGR
jgi:hypothetical protein